MSDKTQRRFEKDVRKSKIMILNGLQAIYIRSNKYAKMWGVEFIPFEAFDIIINKSKLKPNSQASEEIAEFNKTITALHGDLVVISKKNSSENIPLVNIRKGVNICKENWEKKMNGYYLKEETKEG